jgi:hypothetical protein
MPGATPIYAFPYPDPSDLVANYPALGQDLAEDVENVIAGLGGGLNLISPTTTANSGGTVTVTGGAVAYSGVSSVSLNGVFSDTYSVYRIILLGNGSTGANLQFRYRAAGTDATGSDYYNRYLELGASYSSNGGSAALNIMSISRAVQSSVSMDIGGVRTTGRKTFTAFSQDSGGTTSLVAASGQFNIASTYDGITFFPASGDITGTVRVYGYEN